MKEIAYRKTDKLLVNDLIEPSHSLFSALIVLVKKKTYPGAHALIFDC